MPAAVREQHVRPFADGRAWRVHHRGEVVAGECSARVTPWPAGVAVAVAGALSTRANTTAAADLPITPALLAGDVDAMG
ncbi:hypothetical protein ADL03_05290 [Nocardia sp. NRRL S-836]|nr:hypothetical protein ADL03_05290 [Nocardia sp. NRRL S-836]